MKCTNLLIYFSLVVLFASSSCGYVARQYAIQREKQKWESGGSGEAFTPFYDANNVLTITGTIDKIGEFTAHMFNTKAVRIFVATEDKTYEVHLGPVWYVEELDFSLMKGDRVKVTGALFGKKIMAREVEKEGKVLLLRNKDGQPKWFRKGHQQNLPHDRH